MRVPGESRRVASSLELQADGAPVKIGYLLLQILKPEPELSLIAQDLCDLRFQLLQAIREADHQPAHATSGAQYRSGEDRTGGGFEYLNPAETSVRIGR